RADYSIRFEGSTVIVTHRDGGPDGEDHLVGIEELQFGDDSSVDLAAGIRIFDAQGELRAVYVGLEAALTAAVDGDVVELGAGTHVLNIGEDFAAHLSASITLRGANAGIAGHAARGAESLMQVNGDALKILAANVVIDGVRLQGSLDAEALATGLVVRNSVLDAGIGTALHLQDASGALLVGNRIIGATGIQVSGFGAILISGNHIESSVTGLRLEPGLDAENAQITNNTFNGGQYGISLQGEPEAYANAIAITVSGNTFLAQTQV